MKQRIYEKLNERIDEQAYESALGKELTKEQLQKLIQDKFERARKYHESLAKLPTLSVNWQHRVWTRSNEDFAPHLKHGANGRPTGWIILVWIKKW